MATLTKENRTALREMEFDMVSQLFNKAKKSGRVCNCEARGNEICGTTCVNFEGHNSVRGLLLGRTINATIRAGRLSYYTHLNRQDPDATHKRILDYRLDGKRKIGRPCFTWNDCLKQDIRKSGIPKETWQEISHDRGVVKQKTIELLSMLSDTDSDDSDHIGFWDNEERLLESDFEGFADEE